jgi:hypothetical protein
MLATPESRMVYTEARLCVTSCLPMLKSPRPPAKARGAEHRHEDRADEAADAMHAEDIERVVIA